MRYPNLARVAGATPSSSTASAGSRYTAFPLNRFQLNPTGMGVLSSLQIAVKEKFCLVGPHLHDW